ncbi:DUF305 domain-containing protein [Geodermatophilus sp. SYSU D00758]
MTRTTARLGGLAAALVAGTLLLAGCGDDAPDAVHDGPMMGSSDASDGAGSTVDDTDVAFVRDMIPHHQQAIQMARLAEDQAEDPRVRDLAARIEAAQQPEIEQMSGWLDEWDVGMGHVDGGMDGPDGDTGSGDTGSGMGGTMSGQDMHALMTATGGEFDRLFLEQMIEHHVGAVRMAETVIADGRDPDVGALAEAIRDAQTAEIAQMQQLLTELGG